MSIWHMENNCFLEQFESVALAVEMGVSADSLFYVAVDESGFEVTSVQSWTVPLI